MGGSGNAGWLKSLATLVGTASGPLTKASFSNFLRRFRQVFGLLAALIGKRREKRRTLFSLYAGKWSLTSTWRNFSGIIAAKGRTTGGEGGDGLTGDLGCDGAVAAGNSSVLTWSLDHITIVCIFNLPFLLMYCLCYSAQGNHFPFNMHKSSCFLTFIGHKSLKERKKGFCQI